MLYIGQNALLLLFSYAILKSMRLAPSIGFIVRYIMATSVIYSFLGIVNVAAYLFDSELNYGFYQAARLLIDAWICFELTKKYISTGKRLLFYPTFLLLMCSFNWDVIFALACSTELGSRIFSKLFLTIY